MTDAAADTTPWFEIDFEDTPGIDDESGLAPVPRAFLQRARSLAGTFGQEGVRPVDTGAWYEGDRLALTLRRRDSEGRMVAAALRIEISPSDWDAAWVTPGREDQDDMETAEPVERAGGTFQDPAAGVDAAVAWLGTQVARPIVRLEWQQAGRTVARAWMVEDTGRTIAASGPRELITNPASATSRHPVHG